VFEQDLARSRPVTFARWSQRPWYEKALERFSALFASQM
jgi:hypothetical protein